MNTLEYIVHWIIYEILILFCVAPLLFLALALPDTAIEGQFGWLLNGLVGLVVLACVMGTPWLAHNAARRRVFEEQGPFEALANAFAEARLLISFVPVVGVLFRRREPKRSPFAGPDDDKYE